MAMPITAHTMESFAFLTLSSTPPDRMSWMPLITKMRNEIVPIMARSALVIRATMELIFVVPTGFTSCGMFGSWTSEGFSGFSAGFSGFSPCANTPTCTNPPNIRPKTKMMEKKYAKYCFVSTPNIDTGNKNNTLIIPEKTKGCRIHNTQNISRKQNGFLLFIFQNLISVLSCGAGDKPTVGDTRIMNAQLMIKSKGTLIHTVIFSWNGPTLYYMFALMKINVRKPHDRARLILARHEKPFAKEKIKCRNRAWKIHECTVVSTHNAHAGKNVARFDHKNHQTILSEFIHKAAKRASDIAKRAH